MNTHDSKSTSPMDVQVPNLLFDHKQAQGENGPNGNWRDCFPEIVGRSEPMLKVLEIVSKVARSDSAVLIYGESGTGKELIASALHRLSHRANKRFVAINCSAIPENLLESELFGHEKGAFTGADRRRSGHFEVASGGTIFLDEIGDMPLSLQAKLLRVLQEKKFTPLGGNEMRIADVRIIAATNIDLEEAIRKGTFRLDLYYRLNVLPIHVPSLRDRREDLPLLLDHFMEIANRVHHYAEPCYLAFEVIDILKHHSWPGNVRQLQNLVERLVVMKAGGKISIENLPREFLGPPPSESASIATTSTTVAPLDSLVNRPDQNTKISYPETFGHLPAEGINLTEFIEDLENKLIMQALERTNQNKNQAAKLLGLNRTTLVERIKKRQIVPLNPPSREL